MISRDIQVRLAHRFCGKRVEDKVKKSLFESRGLAALYSGDSDKAEYSSLVFIDIADFSKLVSECTPAQTSEILGEFYLSVIPVIYNNNGLIDRIVGDGIVAVFSPFLNEIFDNNRCEDQAIQTAEKLVSKMKVTDTQLKAALCSGEVMYCKTGLADYYEDYTIIGKAVTTIYRLDDIAYANQILLPYESRLGADFAQELTITRTARLVSRTGGREYIDNCRVEVTDEDLKGLGRIKIVRLNL